MIGSLQTWQWAATPEAAPLFAGLRPDAPVSTLAGLRARWSADQIAVATEIVNARSKARPKFGIVADRLIADADGLQMASSFRAAGYKADRFRQMLGTGASVLDACCGIGGDTMALAGAGLDVTALDLDERRAWMAGHNAGCVSVTADAVGWQGVCRGVHVDPARRTAAGRTRLPEQFEPSIADIGPLLRRSECGAIKAHPGVRAEQLPEGELEIISESGSLTQAILWTGRSGNESRRATLLAADGSTHSIASDPDRPDESAPVGDFIHTMDPSLERADVVGALLRTLDARLVFPGTGLLTAPRPIDSAWLSPFRVIDVMPWNRKAVHARLRSLKPGIVVVKTRGGLLDADRLSRDLRGKGPAELVVFVMPIDGRLQTIITQRTQKEPTPPEATAASDGAGIGAGS